MFESLRTVLPFQYLANDPHPPFFCTEPQKITPFLKKLAWPKPQEPLG